MPFDSLLVPSARHRLHALWCHFVYIFFPRFACTFFVSAAHRLGPSEQTNTNCWLFNRISRYFFPICRFTLAFVVFRMHFFSFNSFVVVFFRRLSRPSFVRFRIQIVHFFRPFKIETTRIFTCRCRGSFFVLCFYLLQSNKQPTDAKTLKCTKTTSTTQHRL